MDKSDSNMPGEVTLLLRRFRAGDEQAHSRLLTMIYAELKRLAQRQFVNERIGHVLQPTALVHEAYLRLVAHEDHSWENRSHFFAAAARVMRRILIEHARARDAQKREGAQGITKLDNILTSTLPQSAELLDLNLALEELETLSPRQARVVELRYFCGLSVPEVARALEMNPRSVDRDWATARAWLRTRLQG